MGKVKNNPRRGSKQFWPRVRSQKIIPRLRNIPKIKDFKPLAFMGYKAGMTHVLARDNNSTSLTKSKIISIPVTIIDCPPLKPLSLRFYNKTKLLSEVYAEKIDKTIKSNKSGKIPENYTDIRLVVYSQPKKTSLKKKNPDIFEMSLGGKDHKEKITQAQELLKKQEIPISEIFDEGQIVDAHSITKGKGFQGPVKRFGVKLRQHKSEKTKRGPGNLGAWTPKRVAAGQIAQAGKMGYHQRTEYNKLLIKISKPDDVNQSGGIKNYGLLKSDCILMKGSIAGAAKRPIILTTPRRAKKSKNYEIVQISTVNKQ
jgi:large subunit ribosomal protein L3